MNLGKALVRRFQAPCGAQMWPGLPEGPACCGEVLAVTPEGLCRRPPLVGVVRTSFGSCVEVGVVCEWRGGDYSRNPEEREMTGASTEAGQGMQREKVS